MSKRAKVFRSQDLRSETDSEQENFDRNGNEWDDDSHIILQRIDNNLKAVVRRVRFVFFLSGAVLVCLLVVFFVFWLGNSYALVKGRLP